MHHKLIEVLEAINEWNQDPKDIEALVERRSTPRRMPPPQITWVLLGLMYYRARKRWAWNLLTTQLPAAFCDQNENEMVTVSEVLESRSTGTVPGLSEWTYELDGNASFLTNRVSGEVIHIDAPNGPDDMCSIYFQEFLKSHRKPGPVVQRLLQLFPGGRGLTPALNQLAADGLFHMIERSEVDNFIFELCHVVDPYVKPVRAFLSAWRDETNWLQLGTLIGDWDAVKSASSTVDNARASTVSAVAANAETSRKRWLTLLCYEAGRGLYADLLYALAHAKPENLSEYLSEAFDDPSIASEAVEIVSNDPAWLPQIESLFHRCLDERYFSSAKCAAAFALARSGADTKPLIDGLMTKPANGRQSMLLALEFSPLDVFPLIRHSLRSGVSWERLTAASILALLDTDGSRQELLTVLEQSSDQDATIECRTALRESADQQAHLAVDNWEAGHPDLDEQGAISDRYLYRIDGGCDRAIRNEMLKLSELVADLRCLLEVHSFDSVV